jgi:beta-phosphoglucomutase
MIEAVIFDFDGVIVDSEPLHHAAFNVVFEQLGLSISYEQYVNEYIGFDDRDAIRYACRVADRPLDDELMQRMIADKARAFEAAVANGAKAIPGAVSLIRSAAARWPIAIASGALRADIDLILPALADDDLASLFGVQVTADDVAHSKPDPTTYLMAAQALGVDPATCVAIEDTPTGLTSAKAAGMRTIAVATSYPVDQLQADKVIEGFDGVDAAQIDAWFG